MDEHGVGQFISGDGNGSTKNQNLKNYYTLVFLMLSAQTKDEITNKTMRYLVKE